VVEFNDYFKALITDRRKEVSDQRVAFLTSSNVSSPLRFREDLLTIQLICDSANNVYEQMVRDGLWSSTVKSKNLPASQVLITSTLTCFNCGKQQHIRDCPEPRNIQLVSQNKTKLTSLETEGGLSDNVLEPGQTVSVDLHQSTILGRLPHTKGKEPDDENAKSSSTLWFERIVGKSSSGRSIGRLSPARGCSRSSDTLTDPCVNSRPAFVPGNTNRSRA
jgi:hypothetical protein